MDQVADLLDAVHLSDVDIDAILKLITIPTHEPASDEANTADRRSDLQRQLSTGAITLERFTRESRQLIDLSLLRLVRRIENSCRVPAPY